VYELHACRAKHSAGHPLDMVLAATFTLLEEACMHARLGSIGGRKAK
jgi:hypothetical protein